MDQTPYTAPRLDEAINVTSIGLAVSIVQAYVGKNAISPADLPKLITDTHRAVASLYTPQVPAVDAKQEPAVAIRKSITPDFIICLEDGKKFKSLKRHLATHYKMTPDQYREKWGLPADYPMVAPNYSIARSQLAKASGLGTKGVSH